MSLYAWSRVCGAFGICMAMTTGLAIPEDRDRAVPTTYRHIADLFDIPPDIFYAIALQESGRYVEHLGERRPWPWTLNVAGEGYYFESQAEAWDALRTHVENGDTNIGVGLMQVTWPYNQYALVDIYSALDPATNLRLGAQILTDCYDRLQDWWASVGCYHSPGSSKVRVQRANNYTALVRRRWASIGANSS